MVRVACIILDELAEADRLRDASSVISKSLARSPSTTFPFGKETFTCVMTRLVSVRRFGGGAPAVGCCGRDHQQRRDRERYRRNRRGRHTQAARPAPPLALVEHRPHAQRQMSQVKNKKTADSRLYSLSSIRISNMRTKLLAAVMLPMMAAGQTALDTARAARDSGDAATLRARIAETRRGASLEALLQTSLLNSWLCEALFAANDVRGVKDAAAAGIAAAERAVRLAPGSSEAHRLLGDLLGQLIPHVFAGGIRYGARSTKELDRALELDPRNVDAHIARATSYFFTPSAFGGDSKKALDELHRAIELDPNSDTARLWLAQVYAGLKQKDRAFSELDAARRINPNRAYARYVASQIGAPQ
jgi:tetratricopeptide (TPR) repeat protein